MSSFLPTIRTIIPFADFSLKFRVFSCFYLLVLTNALLGQESISKKYELDPVTITATRTEKLVAEVGRSVTVISKEDIASTIYTSVGELLSQQAGIYIPGAGQNPGALQSTYLRGANNNQAVILIDGIRLMDPSSVDNAVDLAELSLAGVERIEIVRGAHSTLYGSSAIGGVINIITKGQQEPGWHLDAAANGGTFGEQTRALTGSLYANYSFENGLYFSGEILHLDTRGLDETVDSISNPAVYRSQDHDNFSKTDLIGRFGYRKGDWDVFASYKHISQESDLDDGAYTDDDNHFSDVGRDFITWGTNYNLNRNITLGYSGGYSDFERLIYDDSSAVDASGTTDHAYYEGYFRGTTLQNEIQVNAAFSWVDLLLGANVFRETMSSGSYFYSSAFNFTSEENLDSLGLDATSENIFVQADLNGRLLDPTNAALARLGLVLGGRFTHHTSYGTHFTWEVNPSFKLSDETLLYASVSSGYNSPSAYRLFAPNRDFVSGITRGNPNLLPETSVSFELGFKQQIRDRMSFQLSLFRTVTEDLIEYVYLWDGAIGLDTLGNDWLRNDFRGDTYLNIGRQTNTGIEVSFASDLSDKVTLHANLSLINGKLDYDPGDLDRDVTQDHHVQLYNNGRFLTQSVEVQGLVRRPHTANVNVTYRPSDKLSFSGAARYAAARSDVYYESTLGPYGALATTPVGDYTLFDVTARLNLTKHMSITLRVENLLNTDYLEINGYTTRGRGVYLGVRYQN